MAFKALDSLLFVLISFSPSLSTLFSSHGIRREGRCGGIVTRWEKGSFISVSTLPVIAK